MIARPQTSDAASSRRLTVRRRLDIELRPVMLRGKRVWHLKDPLSLRYWEFGEEEFFLWQQLDGTISLSDWQERFGEQFAPRRIDLLHLQYFLGVLHREGLVLSDAPGQAETMLERRATFDRRQKLGALSNLLAIRFRGVDPEPFLARAYPWLRGLFHPLAVTLSVLFIFSAALLLLLRWPEFIARLPASDAMFAVDHLVWFAVALAMTKVLHELGHAFTNKHFGGQCHELGLMFLVFTPCLYCNVSDTWLVSDKWKRIAVSAAGMYVDLFLAAVCTWLWWFSTPGLLHSLCFSIMVVGSIGTLFINGNPLLRYDGYFILSDWLEIPNLKFEADEQLRRVLFRGLGFQNPTSSDPIPRRVGLFAYAVLSNAYRLFVFAVVLLFIHRWFLMRRFEGLGALLIAVLVAATVLPLVWQFGREWRQPRRVQSKSFTWWLLRAAAVGAVVIVCLVPWPRRVTAPVTMTPRDAVAVYVSVPGRLVECVEPGTPVRSGQMIARLESSDLDYEIVQLKTQRDQLRKHCELLGQQQVQDARAGMTNARAQLPIARQSLVDVEQQLEQRAADHARLTLHAPCDGVLVAPRARMIRQSQDELADWEGNPLASENRGCFLESGVLVGYVATSDKVEGTVLLHQSVVGEIGIGQTARVKIDELPGQKLEGQIVDIASTTTAEIPPELLAKGWFIEADPEQAIERNHYQAKLSIAESIDAPFGSSGRAKISVAPQSLFARARDSLMRTFQFSPNR